MTMTATNTAPTGGDSTHRVRRYRERRNCAIAAVVGAAMIE